MRIRARYSMALLLGATIGLVGCGSSSEPTPTPETSVQRSLEEIVAEYAPVWMALDGVVGVYQGRDDAGRSCLKVMVVEETEELRERIPETVEGYPVLLRPTGPIAPRDG